MSADRSTKRQIALAGAAFIVLWAVLQILCPYHLAFKEQADYFLLDRTFVQSFLMKPAFLSELAGGWRSSTCLWDSLRWCRLCCVSCCGQECPSS